MPTDYAIKNGRTVFDATTYTGNTTGQSITNAGGFKPDLVWIKSRSNSINNVLTDSVRGTTKYLVSNLTDAEGTYSNGVTSFNSNGFTLGNDGGAFNANAATFVGWQWQAGQGTTSSNTSGSITSTVSVNASAGFSIVTYTGTAANATVGHGLGVAPKFMIFKNRSALASWECYHDALGATKTIRLNSTAAAATSSTTYNNTAPTSTVVSIGTDNNVNGSGNNHVAYCWSEVAGFSKFGSYVGNGSADGPFCFTGFRPKFVMVKRTDSTGEWIIKDTARDTYNQANKNLYANLSNAEDTYSTVELDILSNGFKLRGTATAQNASGGTYVFMAFAENPFKYANAR